ncbi:MAG TPA: tetratricopeptide repeat protein [Elusimicrobiota bacterium]|nr:tetratricopeptide repeat protein [Elusimicrobiota bacterium]
MSRFLSRMTRTISGALLLAGLVTSMAEAMQDALPGSSSAMSETNSSITPLSQPQEFTDWKTARKTGYRILEKDKRNPDGWIVIGRSYLIQKKYKKAVKFFKKALKYNPHASRAYFWKGQAFEQWGKLDEANNEYQAAFRADPHFQEARDAWTRLDSKISTNQ